MYKLQEKSLSKPPFILLSLWHKTKKNNKRDICLNFFSKYEINYKKELYKKKFKKKRQRERFKEDHQFKYM